MRALLIGKFQPFHKGHLSVVNSIVKEADELIIGIGSAQYSHSRENPFTAGERYLMINKTLMGKGIDNYYIIPIEDLNNYGLWVSHVDMLVPKYDVVFTNNPLTKRLFEEKGHKVQGTPIYDREKFSGTNIRKQIANGGNWQDTVPKPVAEVIEQIDGIARLKQIFKTDSIQE